MSKVLSFEDIQRQVQEALKGIMPTQMPAFAKGVVEAPQKGWCKAEYYDALTGAKFSFYEPPTVVAVALVREGASRFVTAPTIQIPTVELATMPKIEIPTVRVPSVPAISFPELTWTAAPAISVPSITLPTVPTITIPKPEIPYSNENFPAFYATSGVGHDVVQALCDQLNTMRDMLYRIQGTAYIDGTTGKLVAYGINGAIYFANLGLKAAYETVEKVIKEISDFRDNAQGALNDYSGKIKASVDAGLEDLRNKAQYTLNKLKGNIEASVSSAMTDYSKKVQEAFNSYRASIESSVQAALNDYRAKTQAAFDANNRNIQTGVSAGLSQFIPSLYDMMGLPSPSATVSEAERKALMEMGDVNGDGVIDQKDMDLLKAAWGAFRGEPGYNEACDLNHDDVIDASDLAILSRNYGKSIVPTTQLLSPAQLRNVTRDGFEFYGLSAGMKLSYVAIGRR